MIEDQAVVGWLPPGWEAVRDPRTNGVYYHDTASGLTQWQRPQGAGPVPVPLQLQLPLDSEGTKATAQDSKRGGGLLAMLSFRPSARKGASGTAQRPSDAGGAASCCSGDQLLDA